MRFIVTMMHQASVQGRAILLLRPDDTPDTISKRLRERFLEDARYMRESRTSQVMTEGTLEKFADLAERVAREQAATGESRYVTAYTRGGDEVHHSEGQIALLSSADDITCIIEVLDSGRLERNGL